MQGEEGQGRGIQSEQKADSKRLESLKRIQHARLGIEAIRRKILMIFQLRASGPSALKAAAPPSLAHWIL